MGLRTATLSLTLLLTASANAATIVIVNDDGPGEGFNDPALPANANQAGNNPGTTLGELRTILFDAAATIWEQALGSSQVIRVSARFDELFCEANSATLGSAGPTATVANFPNGQANTAYPIALAETLGGASYNGSGVEIDATFNSLIDSDGNCLGGGGFYYGLDDNAPAGTSALFSVVLHELGHGLGFVSQTGSNGQFLGINGYPDIFSRKLFDLETGKRWDEMTNDERSASSLNGPDLVWTGAQVTADRGQFLDGAAELVVNSPPIIAGTFPVTLGQESSIVLNETGVTADIADGDALGTGCQPVADFATLGAVLLFESSNDCTWPSRVFFTEENDNGVGVLISNDTPTGDADISGIIGNYDPTIPYVGITQALGNDIRTQLTGVNVTLRRSSTRLLGTNGGRLIMYAPVLFKNGSSVSHWSTEATPDLLMEPNLGNIRFDQTDLTLAAFKDMGWPAAIAPIFKDGFEKGL